MKKRIVIVLACGATLAVATLNAQFAGNASASGRVAPTTAAKVPRDKIVFTNTDPANPFVAAEIYIMNPDGSEPRRLTNDTFADSLPSISKDGHGKIVFDSNRRAVQTGGTVADSDLFLMNADGTADGAEFPTPLVLGSSANWSPGHKFIAFHRSASGTYGTRLPGRTEPGGPTTDSDIFVLNVDDFLEKGEGPVNITNGLPNTTDCVPPAPDMRGLCASDDADWSPDGNKIAFTSRNPNNPSSLGIYVMNLLTGAVVRLTASGVEERSPDWFPDGTRIAFMRRPAAGQPFEIWVLDLNPDMLTVLAEHRLTFNTFFDGGPSWSPTGDEIVFQTNRPFAGTATGQQVWVMDANGSNQRPLTGPAALPALPGALQGVNFFPNWGQVGVGPK